MINRLGLIVAFACAVILAAPVAASAACFVSVDGKGYVDTDCDNVPDISDNCPAVPNGDCAADPLNCDMDGDGAVTNTDEELAAGEQWDWNDNGKGDACDDTDSDTVADYTDNCRDVPNLSQDPAVCDDTDGDGVMDPEDNCVEAINPSQNNRDGDSIGDACDVCPFTTNEDQDPLACPASARGPIPEADESTTPTPHPGITVGGQTTHVDGSGGCSLSANVAATPWALLMMVAAGAIAAVRRKR